MSRDLSNRLIWGAQALLVSAFFLVWVLYVWWQAARVVPEPVWISPNNLFNIYWFGLMGVLAFVFGWAGAACYHAGLFGHWPDRPLPVFRLVIIALLFGRLFALLNPSPAARALGFTQIGELALNPVILFNFRYGGLDPAGIIIGGLIVLSLYYWNSERFWNQLLPAAAFGHAIGGILISLGRYLNQEFYGAPSGSWFAVFISENQRLSLFQNFETYQPIFLYLSLFYMLGGALILFAGQPRARIGAGIYLLLFILGQLFTQQGILIPHVRALPLVILFVVAMFALVRAPHQASLAADPQPV